MDTSLRSNNCTFVRVGMRVNANMIRGHRSVAKRVRRNRLFGILVLIMSVVTFCTLCMPKTAVSAVPEKFVTYTVRPGDTLWNYAATITPTNGDVADNVEKLIALNHLSSADLEVGQSINVPIVDAQ